MVQLWVQFYFIRQYLLDIANSIKNPIVLREKKPLKDINYAFVFDLLH